MCSIFGAIGHPDISILERIRKQAKDRGRDGGRMERYDFSDGRIAYLGNWRATPTTEIDKAPLQPYDGLVHNGTIANDKELGGRDGEVDSQVLARVLDRSSLSNFVDSLLRVVGSYALGVLTDASIYLACNYKPIHIWSSDGRTVYFSSMARHFNGVVPWYQSPVRVSPYSVLDLSSGESQHLLRKGSKRVCVVCSAGLDSTTVATMMVKDGWDVCLIHYRYGCRAEGPEADRIPKIASYLGCEYVFLDIPYKSMSGNSPLLNLMSDISGPVAGAEYAHEWVPARNLVMTSIAVAYAEANDYHAVALGNNLEESGSYPDNEEQMTLLMDQVSDFAVQNGYSMRVLCPVGHLMKHEIVKLGYSINVPYQHTWSCYENGSSHCGQCGPCFMRKMAFERNGLIDPVFGG